MSVSKAHFTSFSDDYRTPASLYAALDREFGFAFDPCPLHSESDGLTADWTGPAFVNPPYSSIKQWAQKAHWEWSRRGIFIVMLVPSRTDTSWWHDFIMDATEIRFLRGRVNFNDDRKSRAPFPSAIVIFGTRKAGSNEEVTNQAQARG